MTSVEDKGMAIIKVDAFRCEKCGHIWISKIFSKNNPPVACAKCKSAYWNRPKKK
jgi:predicted Zn-ribbon and HTH transcriptional regulator